jgi:hypothetical protein
VSLYFDLRHIVILYLHFSLFFILNYDLLPSVSVIITADEFLEAAFILFFKGERHFIDLFVQRSKLISIFKLYLLSSSYFSLFIFLSSGKGRLGWILLFFNKGIEKGHLLHLARIIKYKNESYIKLGWDWSNYLIVIVFTLWK